MSDTGGRDPLGPLRPGDRVAVVAPSGPAPAGQLDRATALLRSWQLAPVVFPSAAVIAPGSGVDGRSRPLGHYLAGPDARRAEDLQTAWCDPGIAGIFCLRGGYGSIRVLDLLDREAFAAAAPKPLYGSSDITGIHEWLHDHLGVASWFTPMVGTASLLDDEVAARQLRDAVLTPYRGRVWRSDAAVTLVPGRATGTLIGGNLSLLAMTVGARRRPPVDHTGAVVLLEDVNEDTYRVDGYLHALLRSGWFDGIAAVVLGSWHRCGPVAEIHDLVVELLGPLGVPIVGELGFGHGPGAASLPLGVSANVLADDSPQLALASP